MNGPTIHTDNQELLVYKYFNLSATSDVETLNNPDADKSINWSLIGDYSNISLSGNTITVTELGSLGDSGTNITVTATDAYGFSSTKIINVIKTILNGPTIHTGNITLILYNNFNLSATSAAASISGAETSITWSLNNVYSNISLYGNTITVTNLDLLGDSGTDITLTATDAYGFSSTKTINIINDGLYYFNSHTFTNAGASGRNGPTLASCQSSYSSASWAQNTAYFNMTTQGVQLWTVPKDGYYEIICTGARGGNCPPPVGSQGSNNYGGNGSRVKSFAYLSENDVLSIVVGQQGTTSLGSWGYSYLAIAGGGGGGSFVYRGDNLICAAGGGGGAHHDGMNERYSDGRDASANDEGANNWDNGNNAPIGSGSTYTTIEIGGGGAGFYSDGATTLNHADHGYPQKTYYGGHINGYSKPLWEGGVSYGWYNIDGMVGNGDGGFGGGGGVYYATINYAGGGGGFTGGNGEYIEVGGGGGGNYWSSLPPYTSHGWKGYNTDAFVGHGTVIITFLSK